MRVRLLLAVLLGFVVAVNGTAALYEFMKTVSPETAVVAFVASLLAEALVGVCLLIHVWDRGH